MQRRRFLQSSAALLLSNCRPATPPHALEAGLSAVEILHRFQAGRLSPETLLRHYGQRIACWDRRGPALHSVMELHPDAFKLASTAASGPLHGLPILIKDNIETADGMLTTAGSLALVDAALPSHNAEVVRRLRAAGAIIFGKTNLSEWANIRSSESSSGWSARGGLTRNPHHLEHSASGSSSGSAVAVAAGFCAAALGTETNGSIISPAAACGIVGLKPTVGAVSRRGIVPITSWQDTAGPMTRTVRDAALLMNVMAGVEADDETALPAPNESVRDHTAWMTPGVLQGVRFGVVRDLCGHHPQVLALFQQTLEKLHAAGAVIVDDLVLPNHRLAGALAWRAMLTEFRAELNPYLEQRGGRLRSLADVMAFNRAHADMEMPHFGQDLFEEAERRGSEEALAEARQARQQARLLAGPMGIDAVLSEQQLDALIGPTNDPVQRITLAGGDASVRCLCGPAAVAGYPHLTLPMGRVEGLPVGFSLFGAAWSEPRLLAYGEAVESLLQVEVLPDWLRVAAKPEEAGANAE